MAPPPPLSSSPPPRAVSTLTQICCGTPAEEVPVPPAKNGTGKKQRRWTDKLMCRFVDAVMPPSSSRRAAATETTKVEPCDVQVEKKRLERKVADHHNQAERRQAVTTELKPQQHYCCDVAGGVENEKQRLEREVAEYQARRRRRSHHQQRPIDGGQQALQKAGSRPDDDDGDAAADQAVNLDARPKKGILKVRGRPAVVAATAAEETTATENSPTLVELLFPTGFLSKPPRSFRSSGPEKAPAFLMFVIAAAADKKSQQVAGSGTQIVIDRGLVDQWSEAKMNSSRRSRYLRDYCPFQSAPVPEAETLPPEPDHVEGVPRVKTGLPFDSPADESAFVKAIVSRHLLKDDFVNRASFRSCERFKLRQGDGSAGGRCREPRRKVTFRGC